MPPGEPVQRCRTCEHWGLKTPPFPDRSPGSTDKAPCTLDPPCVYMRDVAIENCVGNCAPRPSCSLVHPQVCHDPTRCFFQPMTVAGDSCSHWEKRN